MRLKGLCSSNNKHLLTISCNLLRMHQIKNTYKLKAYWNKASIWENSTCKGTSETTHAHTHAEAHRPKTSAVVHLKMHTKRGTGKQTPKPPTHSCNGRGAYNRSISFLWCLSHRFLHSCSWGFMHSVYHALK